MPFARVNDVELYYELTDFTRPWEGEAQTLLFLHGLHGHLQWWNWFQTAFFAQHYRVLTVDLRGHGKSYKPANGYTIESMAEDVYRLLEQLAVAPAHVCGASMGGMIALQLALARPESVRSLVLVDSFPYAPVGLAGALEHWILDTQRRGYAEVMRTFNQDYATALFSPEFWQRCPEFPAYEAELVLGNLMPEAAFIGACRAIKKFNVVDRLEKIQAPTLVVSPPEGMAFEEAKKMAGGMPHAALWAPEGTGHSVHVEAPEAFNERVLAFLAGI